MAPERIEWRRAFPSRALARLGWYAVLGAVAATVAWVLFGAEPTRLESGRSNPLALVPVGTVVAVGVFAVPMLIPLIRRPVVAADHYALAVRPGAIRTLVLPWAYVTEIAGYAVRGEPLLLIRCAARRDGFADRPRWCDRGVLRAAAGMARSGRRRGSVLASYDLAVRMTDFVGSPSGNLVALAEFVPGHVAVADHLR